MVSYFYFLQRLVVVALLLSISYELFYSLNVMQISDFRRSLNCVNSACEEVFFSFLQPFLSLVLVDFTDSSLIL